MPWRFPIITSVLVPMSTSITGFFLFVHAHGQQGGGNVGPHVTADDGPSVDGGPWDRFSSPPPERWTQESSRRALLPRVRAPPATCRA